MPETSRFMPATLALTVVEADADPAVLTPQSGNITVLTLDHHN